MSINPDTFIASLTAHVRSEMDKLVAEETEAAAERVRERARLLAPRLAMELMTHFDVQRNQLDYVIKVRSLPATSA